MLFVVPLLFPSSSSYLTTTTNTQQIIRLDFRYFVGYLSAGEDETTRRTPCYHPAACPLSTTHRLLCNTNFAEL